VSEDKTGKIPRAIDADSGGAYFPVAPHIEIPADLQMGPVFTTGSTTFYLAITSGIRYTLP